MKKQHQSHDQFQNRQRSEQVERVSRYHRVRHYFYNLLQSPELETRFEQLIRWFITALIITNVLAVMVQTMQEVVNEYNRFLHWLEIFSVLVFTAEYLLRIWVIVEDPKYAHPVKGRLRYMFSFFALVDLFAILPFYLPMIFRVDLRTLRILRLLRLTRLIKLGRYSRAARVFGRIFSSQREQLVMSMAVLLLLLVVSSTMIYYLEHEAQPDAFPSIPASLWWGIVTLTTIGYGDVYPITVAGKLCAAMISILSIGMVALPSGIIVSGFVEEIEKERKKERRLRKRLKEQEDEARRQAEEIDYPAGHSGHVLEDEMLHCPHCRKPIPGMVIRSDTGSNA